MSEVTFILHYSLFILHSSFFTLLGQSKLFCVGGSPDFLSVLNELTQFVVYLLVDEMNFRACLKILSRGVGSHDYGCFVSGSGTTPVDILPSLPVST